MDLVPGSCAAIASLLSSCFSPNFSQSLLGFLDVSHLSYLPIVYTMESIYLTLNCLPLFNLHPMSILLQELILVHSWILQVFFRIVAHKNPPFRLATMYSLNVLVLEWKLSCFVRRCRLHRQSSFLWCLFLVSLSHSWQGNDYLMADRA